MFETLSVLPIPFWVVIAILIGGGLWSFQRINDGTGIPLLAVLGTACAWYVGDAFYNDYANNHVKLFDAATLSGAWWQVAWFLTVFLVATPLVHQWINARYLQRRSGVLQLFAKGVEFPAIQKQLNILFSGCALVWILLFVIALLVLKGDIIYYLFPFLGEGANPWSHGQIGSGFDCFAILAVYLQLLASSMLGVVAALAKDRRVQRQALLLCCLAWPYFIFSRTRNTLLAMIIPAILSWVFLRLRGGMIKKASVLLVCFLIVNIWMKFIIANRSSMSISAAFQERGLNLAGQTRVHNEGLNMFEELCWISTFIDNGKYQVNWGQRYFAELVNPIPRGLWPGKPLIGLDYAIARGHHTTGPEGTVDTTIATGFIGQGVVNFGRILGPMAAALLMSGWVAMLARLDLNVQALGRLPLYSLGLILTFNLGRDITLITLYPFVFGMLILWWMDHFKPEIARNVEMATAPAPGPARAAAPLTPRGMDRVFARRTAPGGFARRTPFRAAPWPKPHGHEGRGVN
jgi:hypothetical protein